MTKITQKMVREVKNHSKKTWHDAAWWAFNNLETTSRIQAAISILGRDASIKQIAEEANR